MKNQWSSVFLILLSAAVLLQFMACNDEPKEVVPDVSNIDADISWLRFDKELKKVKDGAPFSNLIQLREEHPAFFNLYFTDIIPISQMDSQSFEAKVDTFINHEKIAYLLDTVAMVYPEIDRIKSDMAKAMQYYLHYFPGKSPPDFYTLISEFGFQNFIFDNQGKDGIGISLDMFLGADFPYKQIDPTNPSFSDYLTKNYSKGYIVKKCLQVLVEDNFEGYQGSNLLDIMIKEGKIVYILNRLLPTTKDATIMEYSEDQFVWCQKNELQIWNFFTDKELLFENALTKVMKYINPGPTSQGMPAESPGKTGVFIGWKMVDQFMKKNTEMSLMDLIQHSDSQEVMKSYKPARN